MPRKTGFSAMELTLLGVFGTLLCMVLAQDLLTRWADRSRRRRQRDRRWQRV